jgi:hypothetical protein
MRAVRWISGHRVALALLTLIVVLLGLEPMAAVALPVRRGAWYRGTGRQPHWPAGGTDGVSGNFIVSFLVARNGRAGGTLLYRGRVGLNKGCKADGTWTARAWPPPPPVKHFAGKTDQGTRVTFDRTVEGHPRVTNFNFGLLRGTTPSDGTCSASPYTPGLVPPWYPFALPVNNGRFSGEYVERGGGTWDVDISGRFDAKDRASGTLSYGDRGDCHIQADWTAHPAG